MSKIKSRTISPSPEAIREAKIELAVEVAAELDSLVDKLDAFLEQRLATEFDELKDDIKRVTTINDALMEENMRLRDQITKLSLDSLASALIPISVTK